MLADAVEGHADVHAGWLQHLLLLFSLFMGAFIEGKAPCMDVSGPFIGVNCPSIDVKCPYIHESVHLYLALVLADAVERDADVHAGGLQQLLLLLPPCMDAVCSSMEGHAPVMDVR